MDRLHPLDLQQDPPHLRCDLSHNQLQWCFWFYFMRERLNAKRYGLDGPYLFKANQDIERASNLLGSLYDLVRPSHHLKDQGLRSNTT